MQLEHTIQSDKSTHPRSTYLYERWLDSLPGLLLITTAFTTLVGTIFFPLVTLRLTAIFTLYSIIRFSLIGVAHMRGLRRIRETEDQYRQSAAASDVYHLIIVPNFHEPEHILRRSLSRLAAWSHAPTRMFVVLAMEKHELHAAKKAHTLIHAYTDCFAQITYTLHPQNLPGEMRCKSANLAWASRYADTHLLAEFKLDPNKVVVTTMDADTLWHPNYFDAVGAQFTRSETRHARIWQAPIRYHANIYDIHPALRLANVYPTAMELGYLAAGWWPSLPISSYSLSLMLLRQMNYWETNVIADEWRTYINGYFATRGQLKVEPIYLPFTVNAVTGKSLIAAMINRYRQTLRHSWGSKEIGYALHEINRHPSIPGWRVLLSVGHDLIQGSAGGALLTFGSQLPLLLHAGLRENILTNIWAYPAFISLQMTFVITLILGVMFLVLDIRQRPPRNAPATRRERLESAVGFLLLPLYGAVFVILPLIHAQLLLLFGRKLSFEVTAKE